MGELIPNGGDTSDTGNLEKLAVRSNARNSGKEPQRALDYCDSAGSERCAWDGADSRFGNKRISLSPPPLSSNLFVFN